MVSSCVLCQSLTTGSCYRSCPCESCDVSVTQQSPLSDVGLHFYTMCLRVGQNLQKNGNALKQRINRKSENNTKSEIRWKKCSLVW